VGGGLLSLPNMSVLADISYNRFELLSKVWQYGAQKSDDSFWKVRPLIDAFNEHILANFVPGGKLELDELMSSWRGFNGRFNLRGMPHVTKIKSKPEPVGLEMKVLVTSLLLTFPNI
jgi:hypothetical protein